MTQTTNSTRDKAIAAILFLWLVGGAFLYYFRFSIHFHREQAQSIQQLLDKIF